MQKRKQPEDNVDFCGSLSPQALVSAAFKDRAEIVYRCSSCKARLHASLQQRKVKALSLFVFHLHTQYAT